jgi:hypothetical protein
MVPPHPHPAALGPYSGRRKERCRPLIAGVDNWDGGQYEAALAVPPELYDRARNECAEALNQACESLIGASRYRGLEITVQRSPVEPEWIAKIIEALNRRWVPSERLDIVELDPAGN